MTGGVNRLNTLCLIGPPGCGKSTLYRAVVAGLNSGMRCLSAEAGKGRVRSALTRLNFRSLDLKTALAGPVLARSSAGWGEWYARTFSREQLLELQKPYAPLIDADYRALLKEVTDPVRRAAVFAFFIRMVNESIVWGEFGGSTPLLLDDSVWQSLRGLPEMTRPDDLLPVPRAVISCGADPATVFQRILDRKDQGKINTLHGGLNDRELKGVVKGEIASAERKTAFLEKLDIPVLALNMADSLEMRVDRALDFLRDLS